MSVRSFRQAARELGVDQRTIADLVRLRGIKTVPHPSNGRAIGLDEAAFAALKRVLPQAPLTSAK